MHRRKRKLVEDSFFSSRRRHTIYWRDWSSDVCSSDLTLSSLAPSLAGVVTAGQAFGGDLEAVTLRTGLLAARHVLGADVAIVSQGPGNLGTGTPWGFSGVAAGEACNAVTVLVGQPVGALRISDAEPRPRHRCVSHHSLTAFGRVALGVVTLAAPRGLGSELGSQLEEEI